MADYQLRTLTELPFVHHKSSQTMIPLSDPNSDLAELVAYNEWLAAGNTPDPDFDHIDQNVPQQIDNRQFWTKLAMDGHINETTALNAMNEDIPDVIETFILTLPAGEQFRARMFFRSAVFTRHEQAANHTKTIFALNDAAMDQFFTDAALL